MSHLWSDRDYHDVVSIDSVSVRIIVRVCDDEFDVVRLDNASILGSGSIDASGVLHWDADSVASDDVRAAIRREMGDRLI